MRYGRKLTLCVGIGTHVVTSIVCGFSWNVEFLIFFRVLQSIGVSSLLVIGAGVVADIYPPEIRGNALVRSDKARIYSSGMVYYGTSGRSSFWTHNWR